MSGKVLGFGVTNQVDTQNEEVTSICNKSTKEVLDRAWFTRTKRDFD